MFFGQNDQLSDNNKVFSAFTICSSYGLIRSDFDEPNMECSVENSCCEKASSFYVTICDKVTKECTLGCQVTDHTVSLSTGPAAWNSLPAATHDLSSSPSCFYSRVKTELFATAYGVNSLCHVHDSPAIRMGEQKSSYFLLFSYFLTGTYSLTVNG